MYEAFYNLSGKPFLLTPDQKFFFNSKVHNRAMAYLRYGLEQGEGFIVITGAVGTGKTMLVHNLFTELEDRDVVGAQLVSTQVEPEDMLRMVCGSFGVPHEGASKASMLHNLERIARARFAEGKRVLLVVDEAQNLPTRSVEELRMLSNFQVEGRSLFQSFLLGQEEFGRILQQPGMEQVRQRVIASYRIEPLTAEDTRRYIEFRLGQVGWKGDPAFEPETFEGIYTFSQGIPRRINTLCDRLLLFGSLEQLHAIDGRALNEVTREMEGEAGLEVVAEGVAEPPQLSAVVPEPSRTEPLQQEPAPESKPSVAELEQSKPSVEWEIPTTAPAPRELEPAATRVVDEQLLQRVESLEQEVINLKKAILHDRKVLRKAVLMQLELENDDDLD